MTASLRELLGQLADHEARASAATAPDPGIEAPQMRTEIRRHRTGRVVAVTMAAAAVVAIGVVTANAFTAPPPVQPAVPDPSRTVSVSPTPTPSTPTPTPSAAATTSPPVVVDTPPPTLPQAADLAHGNDVWGAYVAVVDAFDTPAAEAAQARITELGYESAGGDIGCDQGAAEALGLPQGVLVVASYFATEQDAALFLEMYGPGTLGVAQVTLFCLD